MIFDEWWNNWSVKDWNDIESAKNLFQQAFEAGQKADVHTDNSKVISDLEAQIEKMKCCQNCKHSRTVYEHCRTNKLEKWEIKND